MGRAGARDAACVHPANQRQYLEIIASQPKSKLPIFAHMVPFGRSRPLLFLPIGQLLVFERHVLQHISRFSSGRKLRLVTAKQFERTIGDLGKRLIHRVKAIRRGGWRINLR